MSFSPISLLQGSDGYLAFFTGPDGIAGDNDIFWHRGTNRLGIGTNAPSGQLHVKNAGGDSSIFNSSMAGSNANFFLQDGGTNKWELGKATDNAYYIWDMTRAALVFRVDCNGQMRLMQAGGNIGIGGAWATATSLLSVHGNAAIGANYGSGTAAPTNGLLVEGSVGIGTNAPATNLQIASTSAGSTQTLRISNDGTATGDNIIQLYRNGSDLASFEHHPGGEGLIVRVNHTNACIRLWTSGIERFTVKSDGYIGIGNTSPLYHLDLTSSNDNTTSTRVNNQTNGVHAYSMIGLNAYGNSWGMRVGSTVANSNRLDFVVDAFSNPTPKLSILTSGNVGIGTINPLVALDVRGATNISSHLSIGGNIINKDLTQAFQSIRQACDGYSAAAGSVDASGGSSGYVSFFTDSNSLSGSSNLFWNNTDGYMGIGTASPMTKLHVRGEDDNQICGAGIGGALEITNTWGYSYGRLSELIFSNDVGGGIRRFAAISSAYMEWNAAGFGGDLRFSTRLAGDSSLTERMRILQGGNVGIGTTAPVEKLDVGGNIILGSLLSSGIIRGDNFNYGIGGALKINSSNTAADQYIQLGKGDSGTGAFTPLLTALSSGKVGIGTDVPTGKLDVILTDDTTPTTLSAWDARHAVFGPTTSDAIALHKHTAGSAYISSLRPGVSWDPLTLQASDFIFYPTANVNYKVVIDTIGHVGIGTDEPVVPLHVYLNSTGGSGQDVLLKLQQADVLGFPVLQIDRASVVRANTLQFSTSGSTDWTMGLPYNGGASTSQFIIGPDMNLANAKLTILTDGKVGIGSVVPTQALDVTGNIAVSGTVDTMDLLAHAHTGGTDGAFLTWYQSYIQSRGMNLVANGTGLLETNYNFSGFTFTGAEACGGSGSFSTADEYASKFTDETMPVDPGKYYEMRMWTKLGDSAAETFYAGGAFYDVDGYSISPESHMFLPSTHTTLAHPLIAGDTEIILTDSANWYEGATSYQRQCTIWGYKNSFGYQYPNYTYSRHYTNRISGYYTNGAWAVSGIVGNTITLTEPWPVDLQNPDDPINGWPVGTPISNGNSGSTFKYFAASNTAVTTTWTEHRGTIGGTDLTGTNVTNKFPPGAAGMRGLWLTNYGGAAGTHTQYIANVWFSELVPSNLIGTDGNIALPASVNVAGALSATAGFYNTGTGGIIAGANRFAIDQSGGTARFYAYGGDGSTQGNYEFHVIASDGSPDTVAMYIHDNGRVGVGAADPGAPLHVSLASDATINEIGLMIGRVATGMTTSNRGVGLVFRDTINQTLTAGIAGVRRNSNADYDGDLAFFTSDTGGSPSTSFAEMSERMRIIHDGKVGIGIAAPTAQLHVNGGVVRIDTPTGDQTSLGIGGGTINRITFDNGATAIVGISGAANFINMYTDGSMVLSPKSGYGLGVSLGGAGDFTVNSDDLVVDTSAGFVGIGTTTPQQSLDISLPNHNTKGLSIFHGLAIGEYIGMSLGYGSASDNTYRKAGLAFEMVTNSAVGKLHFINDIAADSGEWVLADSKMCIDENGYIGIGTTTPEANLHIKTITGGASTLLQCQAGSGAWNGLYDGETARWWYGKDQFNTFTIYDGYKAYSGLFITSDDAPLPHMSILPSGGNVGIGVTEPDALLNMQADVNDRVVLKINNANSGSGAVSSLDLMQNGHTARIWVGGNTGVLDFTTDDDNAGGFSFTTQTSSSYNTRLTILNDGKVGIGTVGPTTSLELDGTLLITNHDVHWTTSNHQVALKIAGSHGIVFQPDDVDGHSYGIFQMDGSIHFMRSDEDDTSSPHIYDMAWDSAGNFGIGTSYPEHKLDVAGTLGVDGYATFGKTITTAIVSYAPNKTELIVDLSLGNCQVIDLNNQTSNIKLIFAGATAGASYIIKIIQDATSARTVTFWGDSASNVNLWPNGTVGTVSTTANAIDLLSLWFDGTYYYFNIIKDMK